MKRNEMVIEFFKPGKGTSQWERVLVSRNREELGFMFEYEINSRDISFLTLSPMLNPDQINLLKQRGDIISLAALVSAVNKVANEQNSVWKKHSLRRLIVGVSTLIKSFENRSLPSAVEQDFRQEIQQRLAIAWRDNNLSEPILARINDLIPEIYKDSFNHWFEFVGEINTNSPAELRFWQETVVSHLLGRSYIGDDIALSNRLVELRSQGALHWLHSNPEMFADSKDTFYTKIVDDFVKSFQEQKLSADMMKIISAKTTDLRNKHAGSKKPHIAKFYRDAVEEVIAEWRQGNMGDDLPLQSWLMQWMQSNLSANGGVSLPAEVFKGLQSYAVNQLINEYKSGQYQDLPLGLELDAALPDLYEERPIEKIHSTASGELVSVVLNRLLDECRSENSSRVNSSVANSLSKFALAPWKNRQESMQEMLQSMIAIPVKNVDTPASTPTLSLKR